MKKFLSLVLALVMTMSLVTVSAGAKDFGDSDKIQYTEAVDVMSAVKVIDGYTDGSFNPSTTLTRGAAAKIICNLILGPTTAGALVADAAPYKDVPVNHTFAGYIAYCQKAGIISGYADGTFKPANSLTGYAFMKMLLGALGYDSTKEGYTGANWSINVAKQALNIGLADDLIGNFNGVKAVTREEACLYAFNMLQADIVEYEKNSTITVGNVTVTDNSAAKSKTWGSSAINDGNIDGKKGGDGYVQFAEEYFNKLKKTADEDEMGRPATKWTNKGDKIGTYTDTPDATYTKNVELGDIYKDLGMTQKDANATVIVNGVEQTDVVVSKNNTRKIASSAANDGLVGDGSIVEVYYDDDNNAVTIVVVDVYVGQVSSKETKVADPYIVLENKSGTAISGFSGSNTRFECDTNAFSEDDIVLFTYSEKQGDEGIQTVTKAQSTEGVVTKYTLTKKLFLGETEYKYSKNIGFSFTNESEMRTKYDYTIYTDANGYVIYVSESEFKPTDYAFVLDVQSSTQVGFNKDQAKLVLADGTVKTVETDDDYATGTGSLLYQVVTYRKTADGDYSLRKAPKSVQNGSFSAGTLTTDGILQGGKDAVTAAQAAAKTVPTGASTNFYMVNGDASIYPGINPTGSKPTVLYGNSETVIVVSRTDASGHVTYSTYTGVKNMPTITSETSQDVEVSYYERGNGILGFMFVDAGHCTVSSGKRSVVFFAGKEGATKLQKDSDGKTYYEYNAVVDGAITTVKVADDATYTVGGTSTTLFDAPNGANRKYNRNYVFQDVQYNNKGTIVTDVAPVDSSDYTTRTGTGIWKLSGAYTIGLTGTSAGNSVRYTVSDSAKMFLVDTDGNITKVEDVKNYISDVNAEFIALVDKRDGDIAYLFVQEVDTGKKDDATAVAGVTGISYASGTITLNLTGSTKAGDVYYVTVDQLMANGYVNVDTVKVVVAADGATSATANITLASGSNYRFTCGNAKVIATA